MINSSEEEELEINLVASPPLNIDPQILMSSENSQDFDRDVYAEKKVYVLVVPAKVGAYVMSVGWSDVNTLEKLNRRKTKVFSKE